MKFITEKKLPKKLNRNDVTTITRQRRDFSCQRENSKHKLDFNEKLWRHQAVELFMQNELKINQLEDTDHARNTVQRQMQILGIRNPFRSIENKCVTCRKGIAQMITLAMADTLHERLDTSTTFEKAGVV